MSATILNIPVIISDPQIRRGHPVITGTTIRVSDLVASHIFRGFSPEELTVQFNLSLGEVYAALAYYYMHKAEIDQQMRDDATQAETLINELEQQGKVIRIE